NAVVSRDVLAVALRVGGNVGGRIAALAEGHAAMRACEVAQLRLPGPVVAGEFVHEHDRRAGADLLVIEAGAVLHGNGGHASSETIFLFVRTKTVIELRMT